MPEVIDAKLIVETSSGSLIKAPAKIEFHDGRILFLKSPFALKDEIKAMADFKAAAALGNEDAQDYVKTIGAHSGRR